MSVLPNLIYKFSTIPTQISVSYFAGIRKLILKYIWQGKRPKYPAQCERRRINYLTSRLTIGLLWWLSGKEFTCNAGDMGWIPDLGRSHMPHGEGNGTPLQCSCLENPMDGGAWWPAVHGVAKSWTWLSNFTLLFTFMHWKRQWQPTPVFLPGESQGRGSLVGCHLWGRTELDTTEAT